MPARKPVSVAPRALLAVHEAAGMLGCSENHVYRLIANGELETVDIRADGAVRSKTRITPDAIHEYIARKQRTA